MHSTLLFAAAGLTTMVQAFSKPTDATWGPLLTPDLTNSVTQGQEFTVTWDPEDHDTEGVTISLILCQGPSSNCVPANTAIAEGIPADAKSFDWNVPCDLAIGEQNTDTGYGMLIIVDGTGEFQYSTQFSVLSGKACSSSGGSSTTTSSAPVTTDANGSIILGPPAQQTGSYSGFTSVSGNGTLPYTRSGEWGSTTATGSAATASSGYTLGGTTYASNLPGTIVTSALATTSGVASTGTASAPGTSASTFPGAASQLSINAAVVVIAGFAALLAL